MFFFFVKEKEIQSCKMEAILTNRKQGKDKNI
jgi:hypothetical protein